MSHRMSARSCTPRRPWYLHGRHDIYSLSYRYTLLPHNRCWWCCLDGSRNSWKNPSLLSAAQSSRNRFRHSRRHAFRPPWCRPYSTGVGRCRYSFPQHILILPYFLSFCRPYGAINLKEECPSAFFRANRAQWTQNSRPGHCHPLYLVSHLFYEIFLKVKIICPNLLFIDSLFQINCFDKLL